MALGGQRHPGLQTCMKVATLKASGQDEPEQFAFLFFEAAEGLSAPKRHGSVSLAVRAVRGLSAASRTPRPYPREMYCLFFLGGGGQQSMARECRVGLQLKGQGGSRSYSFSQGRGWEHIKQQAAG